MFFIKFDENLMQIKNNFKNEEIDSRAQARLFLRYPFQKGFHVLLEVQAWILHVEKVRSIFQDFCYPQFFPFPLVE